MRKLLAASLVVFLLAVTLTAMGLLLSFGGVVSLAAPTVLVLRLHGPLLEQAPPTLIPLPGYRPPLSLGELYRALRAARSDEEVAGLAVYIRDPDIGLAKAEELRRQVEHLRAAGKPVDCYMETAGEAGNGTLAYFLAAACDSIHLAPAGEINLLGLHAQGLFLRGSLDKLRVEPDLAAIGPYKSAVESYTRESWSAAAEEALADILDLDYSLLLAAVAGSVDGSEEDARRLIDGAPYTAEEALELGLVDALTYPDEFRDMVAGRFDEKPRLLELRHYAPRRRGRRIAVVFVQGTIVTGGGGLEPWTGEVYVGAADLSRVLRPLADDDGVAAVVLRVDSPGGSPLASDLILREVVLLAEAKPVVASLSDVAASGGYYIVSGASAIVAETTTITGSIGVYGGKMVTRGLEEELLGITRDSLTRGANAAMYSSTSPFTEEQRRRFEHLLERIYANFIDRVATGRDLAPERVEAIAAGRVWAGARAVDLGLVDELGGLDRALEMAAAEAGLQPGADLRLEFHPRGPGFLEWLTGRAEPLVPLALRPLAELRERPRRLLELPPELTGLGRPF